MTNQTVKKLFLDLNEVAFALSLSASGVQSLVRAGNFPAPRQLSDRRVGWLYKEVEAWAEGRPVSNLPPPPNTGAKKPKLKLTAQDERQAA